MDEIKLTQSQLKKMFSAIKISQIGVIKNGQATLTRNRYFTEYVDKDWIELVRIGLAHSEISDRSSVYYLSSKGIEFIEYITGFKLNMAK